MTLLGFRSVSRGHLRSARYPLDEEGHPYESGQALRF